MPCQVVCRSAGAHSIHGHTNYEVLVVQGDVTVLIGRRACGLRPGSMVFLNQFEEHATRLSGGVYRRYSLLISPDWLAGFPGHPALTSVFRLHGAHFPYVLSAGAAKPAFDAYFAMLLETAEAGGPCAEQRVQALLTLILTHAYRLRPDMFVPDQPSTLIDVRAVLDELDAGFTRRISLADLASRHHVSPGSLARHFKKYVGLSPAQYITQSRLALARRLLVHTNRPVSLVARACGFEDTSNFIRRFRAQMGCPPLRFRRMNSPDQERPLLPGAQA